MICSLFIKSQTWLNVTTDYINNPSFEDYTACPQNTSDPSNYWIDSCKNWSHVTYASPDYLNTCANGLFLPNAGVPNNIVMNLQYPFDGNAYLGFFAYGILSGGNLWCEYIQTKVKHNLIKGRNYKFNMRIIPSKNNAYGISKIGVNMSENSLSNNFQQTSFKFNPTMLNSRGIISDTTKWFLFDEEFVANGNENFITIGWFADTLTSDYGYFDTITNQLDYGAVYYAIDSINLLELNVKDFNINVFTPNNDGVNDVIDFSQFNFKNMEFNLYNRWGNLVFNSSDINLIWVGFNNSNNDLKDGVYFYTLRAEIPDVKDKIEKKGYLSIIH